MIKVSNKNLIEELKHELSQFELDHVDRKEVRLLIQICN